MLTDIFQYGFIVRGLEAGVIVALVAPLIGIFLVLRRYSLIADTLAHVSLAGIALGLLLGLNPIITGLGVTVVVSLGVERLRTTKRVYGESALALFLSGSLALAVVLLSLANGFNTNLFNFLFGSIVTVTADNVYTIAVLAVVVIIALILVYRDLIYVSFDEDAAKVSGIKTRFINSLLIVLAALTVALCIPVVGVLLISALMVVPVITALLLHQSFFRTVIIAEIISLFSMVAGIFTSFYLNLSAGGTIVLIMIFIFAFALLTRKK